MKEHGTPESTLGDVARYYPVILEVLSLLKQAGHLPVGGSVPVPPIKVHADNKDFVWANDQIARTR